MSTNNLKPPCIYKHLPQFMRIIITSCNYTTLKQWLFATMSQRKLKLLNNNIERLINKTQTIINANIVIEASEYLIM